MTTLLINWLPQQLCASHMELCNSTTMRLWSTPMHHLSSISLDDNSIMTRWNLYLKSLHFIRHLANPLNNLQLYHKYQTMVISTLKRSILDQRWRQFIQWIPLRNYDNLHPYPLQGAAYNMINRKLQFWRYPHHHKITNSDYTMASNQHSLEITWHTQRTSVFHHLTVTIHHAPSSDLRMDLKPLDRHTWRTPHKEIMKTDCYGEQS